MKSQVLLVGNGPNQIGKGFSWSNLLDDLREYVGVGKATDVDDYKPFPLLYEELFLRGNAERQISESSIKRFIAERAKHIKPGPIHRQLMTTGFEHILTTNYDHALDNVNSLQTNNRRNLGFTNERRYNLFRHFAITDATHLWHIHGDQFSPETITVGYEQYSGYLQQMRLYTTQGLTYSNGALESLLSRLRSQQNLIEYSWVDFFFTRDIYILGLGLDFVEFHLWWLLTYRARLEPKSEVPVFNRIFYLRKNNHVNRNQSETAKLELLSSNRVKVVSLCNRDTSWLDYYETALDWIEKEAVNH